MWASWAYAWALIAPTAIGLGQIAYGVVAGQPEKVSAGTRGATVGLIIFVVAGAFFELVVGVDGIKLGLGSWVWPLLLILLGVALLVGAFVPRRIRR